MHDLPKYHDARAEFWSQCFSEAADYDTYLNDSPDDKAQRWRDLADALPPMSTEQIERVSGFGRSLNVLVYTGVWCGDCVRQGPMLQQIALAAGDNVVLRCIDREANEQLKRELRIVGAERVPVVVFLSEDFWEIGRAGDRMLSAYRRKAMRELGPACPVPYAIPPEADLAAERDEWLDIFERMLLMVRLSPPLRKRHGD